MFVSGRTPPRTVVIPNALARAIVKRVVNDPRIQRAAWKKFTFDLDRLTRDAIAKVVHVAPDPELTQLQRKLAAESNILKRAAIEREIAFAKLGGAR